MPTELLENFVLGTIADTQTLPGDFTTAADAVNLRTDRNGFLIARQPVTEFLSANASIDGMVAVDDLIFYTSANELYVSERGATAQVVNGADNLEGRLSIIKDYQQFVVIADEAGNAYQIDISEYDQISARAERLSLTPPDAPVLDTGIRFGPKTSGPVYTAAHRWKYQYLDSDGKVSALSEAAEAAPLDTPDPAETAYYNVTVDIPQWDSQGKVDFILVYRSAPDTDSDYRLVLTYVRDPATTVSYNFDDTVSPTERDAAAVPKVSTHYPDTATSIIYYNGLLYATCGTELRWCAYNVAELELGGAVIWNWPAENSVQRRNVNYAIVSGNVILFGDVRNTWSLTKESVLPYVRYVGERGAISTFETSDLEQGWAFISESGFYLGDSQTFQKISAPIERRWTALSDTIISGGIVQFPDDSILFACELASGTRLQYLAEPGPNGFTWNRWNDVNAVQGIELKPRPDLGGGVVTDSDDQTVVDSDGEAVTGTVAGLASSRVLFSDNSLDIKEIAWHDQDSELASACTWKSHKLYLRDKAGATTKKRWRNVIIQGAGGLSLDVEVSDVDTQGFVTTLGGTARFPVRRIGDWLQLSLWFYGPTTIESIALEYDVLKTRLRTY